MIAYLKGEVLDIEEDHIILLVSGVGYKVNLTQYSVSSLEKGADAAVYVAESISPYDGVALYGFLSKEDKKLWELFREAIPNTGAKKALDYLNKALRSVADFHMAISKKDPKILTAIFGFTAKTADKLIVSLKDKIDTIAMQGESKVKVLDDGLYMSEVVAALSALGYTPAESRRTLEKIYAQETITPRHKPEDIIRMALRLLKK
ncbi:holliday junction DNA helicase RuvA [Parelusimicrobium proximum]|uniref:Holliday junction branch migration protein RuvA n=1 Tax=Parelusimicrobium proximum TaxID=3228953 RepID=UPI003D16AD56